MVGDGDGCGGDLNMEQQPRHPWLASAVDVADMEMVGCQVWGGNAWSK